MDLRAVGGVERGVFVLKGKMPSEIKLYNMDCMEAMKQIPDKAFDLAIVDPPYGGGGKRRYRRKIPKI